MTDPVYKLAQDEVVRYVPPSPVRDAILALVERGAAFTHSGKKRGPIAWLVIELLKDMKAPITFEKLIVSLSYEAMVNREGVRRAMVIEVDRNGGTVTFEIPGKGIVDRKFSALERHFTNAKTYLEKHDSTSSANVGSTVRHCAKPENVFQVATRENN